VYSRKPAVRWATVGLLAAIASVVAAFSKLIVAYLARGQDFRTIASLDNKVPVWQACWAAIKQRPILGYGYIIGAKNTIRDHWLYPSQWIPPHAHNDLIQAALQVGLPACLILIYLYIWLLIKCVKTARVSREHLFLFLLVIQLTVIAITGMVLSYTFSSLGAVLILCYLGFSRHDERPIRAWEISSQRSAAFATTR
jgi:O-antigen ligase